MLAASRKGSMTGSCCHMGWDSHALVSPWAKPFCAVNQTSICGLLYHHFRKSLASFWFFE